MQQKILHGGMCGALRVVERHKPHHITSTHGGSRRLRSHGASRGGPLDGNWALHILWRSAMA